MLSNLERTFDGKESRKHVHSTVASIINYVLFGQRKWHQPIIHIHIYILRLKHIVGTTLQDIYQDFRVNNELYIYTVTTLLQTIVEKNNCFI